MPIESLRNLGPTSARWLREVGIGTIEELRKIGPVEAFLAVKTAQPGAGLNLLWALAAGLNDQDWRDLTMDQKNQLRSRLDELNKECGTMRTIMMALFMASCTIAAEPKILRDIPYAEPKNDRQTLDVHSPAEGKNHPIVFWIHGGGWQAGDKKEVQKKPEFFVNKGMVFVSTNYRFVPTVTIKEMAGDIAKSIRWVHDHAEEFGGDPNTFFIMGHSAGAQLAALLCTDDRYLKTEKLSLTMVKGCVPVDGDTYDVPMQIATVEERRATSYKKKFGTQEQQKDLSPVTHVASKKSIPSFLILHVADHPEVKAQSERLVNVLSMNEIDGHTYPAVGKTHLTINSELGTADDQPTRALTEFLERILKMNPKTSK